MYKHKCYIRRFFLHIIGNKNWCWLWKFPNFIKIILCSYEYVLSTDVLSIIFCKITLNKCIKTELPDILGWFNCLGSTQGEIVTNIGNGVKGKLYFYRSAFLDYCLHLYRYIYNISVDICSGLLWVFLIKFEPRPFLNPRGLLTLIPLTITWYKC